MFSANTIDARLPVVDSSGVLVGLVTIDDMLDVAEEEATEDIQKFGGMEAMDEPYMRIPLWRMVRKRATWLVILFLGEMLTAIGDGLLRGRDREGGRARAFSADDHFERRQLRLASIDVDHPRDGARRSDAARLVAGDAKGIQSRVDARLGARVRSAFCGSAVGRNFHNVYGPHWMLDRDHGRDWRWLAWCCGDRSPVRCCRFSCAVRAPIRRLRRRRSSRRWSM